MFYKYGPSNEALYMQVHNNVFIILLNYVQIIKNYYRPLDILSLFKFSNLM